MWAALVAAGCMAGAVPAGAQQVRADDLVLDFTGRVQFQYNTTSVDEAVLGFGADEPATAIFETRRMRLGAEMEYREWITGKVEVDFAGSTASLKDGWLNLGFDRALQLRAGQFKKPFSLVELTSSTKVPVIERGLRIRGLDDAVDAAGGAAAGEQYWLLSEGGYADRDIGIMVHGAFGRLGYEVGTFTGEGANRSEELGSKAYAGRLTYAVVEPLTLGAAVSMRPTGVQAADGEVDGTAWSVDAEWGEFRGGGLWLIAELTGGDNAVLAGADTPAMLGAQAMAAWFLPLEGRIDGWEPALRLSWGDPDTDAADDEGMLVTPGLNLYFGGRNRLMVNGDIYLPGQAGLDAQYAARAQLQVYF